MLQAHRPPPLHRAEVQRLLHAGADRSHREHRPRKRHGGEGDVHLLQPDVFAVRQGGRPRRQTGVSGVSCHRRPEPVHHRQRRVAENRAERGVSRRGAGCLRAGEHHLLRGKRRVAGGLDGEQRRFHQGHEPLHHRRDQRQPPRGQGAVRRGHGVRENIILNDRRRI